MRRLLLILLLLALPAWGGESVHFQAGGETVTGYLAVPQGRGPFPALIVIHEWWGLNDWARQQADKCAEQGYVALAVDLYRGKVATDRDLAHELSRGLPQDRALTDLAAGVNYLKGRPDVNKKEIGSIGWCMGGGYSLDLSLKVPLQATVVIYGKTATTPEAVRTLGGPVLGIFGAEDRGIPPETVKSFEKALTQAGKKNKIILYPGVGHAFMNENNETGYDAGASAKAWTEIWAFLARHLKS